MSLITNFPNGVNNVAYGATKAFISVPDYTPVLEYSDDFIGFSDIAASSPTSHTITNASGATFVQTAGIYGGVLTLTGGATAGNFAIVQTKTSPFAPLQTVINPFAIRTRFKVNTKASCNLIIGLATISSTLFTAGQLADGIYFQYNAGVLTANLTSASTGNTSSLTLATPPVDNTYIILGIRYNSDTANVDVLVNEAVVGTMPSTNVSGAAMAVTIAEKAVTTASNIYTIDYLDVVQVR